MTKRKKFTKSERQQIYDMFNGHCAYCGCEITLKQMQADHIEPLELGGADKISNLYPSCRSCNHYKHTMTIERFRQALERMPSVLMRDSVTYKNAVRFGLIKHPENPKVKFYFEKYQTPRHGYWKYEWWSERDWDGGHTNHHEYCCSVCGHSEKYKCNCTDVCPNCKAIMDGKNEGEDDNG